MSRSARSPGYSLFRFDTFCLQTVLEEFADTHPYDGIHYAVSPVAKSFVVSAFGAARFTALTKEWRTKSFDWALAQIPSSSSRSQDDRNRLDLATSLFYSVKTHQHWGHYFPSLGFHWNGRPYLAQEWPSCDWFKFDEKGSAIVRDVVQACGMDPEYTTVRDMDEMDPRVVCLACAPDDNEGGTPAYGPTMIWRRAVSARFVPFRLLVLVLNNTITRSNTGMRSIKMGYLLRSPVGEPSNPPSGSSLPRPR